MRLDVAVMERGIAKSRTLAQSLIKDGKITVDGKVTVKASLEVDESSVIALCGELPKYVSRGGLKLEKAIDYFHIDLSGAVCLDIGASTGGFTDCMLQHGARKVYAVDVGTAQLVPELLRDERVVSMEQCDIRRAELPEQVDFIGIDVSFISLTAILPCIGRFLKPDGSCAALIKPQFEAGKRFLGKNGVLKDKREQERIAASIAEFARGIGYSVAGVTDSAILGGDGNREFLMCITQQRKD